MSSTFTLHAGNYCRNMINDSYHATYKSHAQKSLTYQQGHDSEIFIEKKMKRNENRSMSYQ